MKKFFLEEVKVLKKNGKKNYISVMHYSLQSCVNITKILKKNHVYK